MTALPIGKGEARRQGTGIASLAFGSMVGLALSVGEALNATVVNMRFIKPAKASASLRCIISRAFVA